MLQWMGGSRRKVTTSRKSTLQRQKQYFEQRKRQQQQTDGLESYSDRKRSCTPHYKSNRSLDILSLVNLSAVAQEHKTSNMTARDNSEDDDCTLNHQYEHPSLAILTNEGTPQGQSEITEERTSLSYGTEAEGSKKVSVHLPDHSEDFVGNRNKLDPSKLSTTHQISLIDLLDYGGGNSNAEENSVRMQEAHVAFSVEGLGEVVIGTPVQSPTMPGRSFPNGFSQPRKATKQPITRKETRQPITFKHLDYGFYDLESQVDVMMQDIKFSPYDSSIGQPLCSRDVEDIDGDPYQKSLNFTKSSPFNWNCKNSLGIFANDELIYNIRDSSKTTWNGSRFLDDSIDDLGEYGSFRKNWVDKRNFGDDDYFHNNDPWKQDISLEGWDLQKKSSSTRERSSTRGTEKFDMRESPFPYTKHQIMEDLPDDIIPDTKWYSDNGIDVNVTNDPNHFAREDSNENLSLPSEESCSSTAVRVDATKKSREAKHGRKSHHSK